MISEKMLLTTNWEERNTAEKLGIDTPARITKKSKVLFWKKDVKRVMIDIDDSIIVITNNDEWMELEYDEKIWKQLEKYFKNNEE